MPKQKYIIVCAPSGSGLRKAIGKLQNDLSDIDVQDVEDILCESRHAEKKLSEVGVSRPSNVPKWPEMYDITWNLSRSDILDLWREAVSEAFYRFRQSQKAIKVLSCHLIYYGGRRDEFYSPIDASKFEGDGFKPSHILLLIDDVYDMYRRLTDEKALFNQKYRIPSLIARIREDEGIDVKMLPPEHLASLCLEWQIGVMTHLISWRHLEIVIAEKLATQLKTNFLVWSAKQLTVAAACWLQKDRPVTVYLSHPISRHRRIFRITKQWNEVVGQFNELQAEFLKNDLICIMPSAIDEYRIHRKSRSGTLALREPILEERWPLPAEMDSIMYSSISGGSNDINHKRVIAFRKWDFENRWFVDLEQTPDSLCERADAMLRCFERQIELQISSRDHLFVSWTNGILIYRPLFLDGIYSSGVKAEIEHWKLLARTDHEKRAAFIHFGEDVYALNCYYQSNIKGAENRRKEIHDKLTEIISQYENISLRVADEVIKHIERRRPSEMFDQGPIDPRRIVEIRSKIPEYRRKAKNGWLSEKLTGHDMGIEVPEEQIAVWVFKNMDDFKSSYSEIANFLKYGAKPSDSSFSSGVSLGGKNMTKDKNNGTEKHRKSKKVFICYETTTGLDYAKHLKEALEKTDRSAFVADEDIKRGEVWQEVIDEAIGACRYFIVIVTFPAFGSKEVEREIKLADSLLSLKGNMIPCKEKSVFRSWLSELPIISELQQIDFESKEELARKVISEILGREIARITFVSDPPGADVYINGRRIGRT